MYRFLLPWLLACGLWPAAWAAEGDVENWLTQLQRRLADHPQMQAEYRRLLAQDWQAEALQQPLYNPELEASYDREGSNDNYLLGLSQTFDLWNRKALRGRQGDALREAASQAWKQVLLERSVQAIRALLDWELTRERWNLAREQEQQTHTLLQLVDQRLQAGDLGEVDAELAYMELSGRLQQTAQAESEMLQAEKTVQSIMPGWTVEQGGVPGGFWPWLEARYRDDERVWLEAHPALKALQGLWQMAEREAELADRSRRPDPTMGLGVGRVDGEQALGLSFSLPLNVRNRFLAESRAAEEQALEAELRWRARWRDLRYRMQSAHARARKLDQRLAQWQALMQARLQRSARLLEAQWQSGDLSTADYLLALDKRIQALQAGLDLRRALTHAWLDWLQASAALPLPAPETMMEKSR